MSRKCANGCACARHRRQKTHMPRLRKHELSWLAGLLEGEGCFYVKRNKKRGLPEYPSPGIRLEMNDHDVVERAALCMGITAKPTPKGTCAATVYGLSAIEIMRAVLPHMCARRTAKIEEVIACFA